MNEIKSFKEFWPYYVSQHQKPSTRAIHFIGTTIGLALLIWMMWSQNWWFFPVGLVVVYVPLFASHYIFERNKPATLKYPFWSVFGDLKMWLFILIRRRF